MDISLDILAIGPHPDDVELGMGGTIAKHAALGHRIGLLDLTKGEMGTNGTVEVRAAEAKKAADILGVDIRLNAGLPDTGLLAHDNGQAAVIAGILRRFRPRIITAPYWEDRHPDHVAASHLITRAWFLAGLAKFEYPEVRGIEPYRPRKIVYYFLGSSLAPTFIIDISDYYSVKLEAIAAHDSQFGEGAGLPTRLTDPLFLELIRQRDAFFGNRAGVRYAEGFFVRDQVVLPNLLAAEWTAERSWPADINGSADQ